jgi:hypothetical protein
MFHLACAAASAQDQINFTGRAGSDILPGTKVRVSVPRSGAGHQISEVDLP